MREEWAREQSSCAFSVQHQRQLLPLLTPGRKLITSIEVEINLRALVVFVLSDLIIFMIRVHLGPLFGIALEVRAAVQMDTAHFDVQHLDGEPEESSFIYVLWQKKHWSRYIYGHSERHSSRCAVLGSHEVRSSRNLY